MSPVAPRSTRIMPALGRRLLTAPACRASHCTAAAAAAAAPGARSRRTNTAAAAGKPWDGRRSLHATARNLGVDPVAHGPKGLLPEFSLKDKVIVVSGGAQGLGLVQTEALLEAGATGRL